MEVALESTNDLLYFARPLRHGLAVQQLLVFHVSLRFSHSVLLPVTALNSVSVDHQCTTLAPATMQEIAAINVTWLVVSRVPFV